MHVIRGLVVDDIPQNAGAFIERVDPHFEQHGWKVHWQQEHDPGAAHRLLRTSPPFDFVVFDLLFERTDLPEAPDSRGLELIAAARLRSARTFIQAITVNNPHRVNLLREARELGANQVTERYQFSPECVEHSPAAICAAVRRFLLNNGTVEQTRVDADSRDPAVQSLLHEVGKRTIAQLHGLVLEAAGYRSPAIEVGFLAPGASGAVICTITAEVHNIGQLRHVLKMSRSEQDLREEAENAMLAGNVVPPRFFVRHNPEKPVGPVNGWYALGAPLLDRAGTLRRWLAGGPEPEVVAEVIEELFTEGLRDVRASSLRVREGGVLDCYAFPDHRKQRILKACAELREALARPEGGNQPDAARMIHDLELFVRAGRLGELGPHELPAQATTTFCHGDLHGANILVYQGRHPRPTLIDANRFGHGHWASDPARLAVDLLMHNIDEGAESLFFTRFAAWRDLAAGLGGLTGPLETPAPTAATRAGLAALTWLTGNLTTFCPPLAADFTQCHWEWRLALAHWLLRAAYYPEVPVPKRTLALAAAHDQLRAAGAR